MKRKRESYEASFKLKVIAYAEDFNNCAAEREFGVNEKLVRDWRKKKAILMTAPKTQKKRRTYLPLYDDLEKDMLAWISDLRQNGYIVTRNAIRLKALNLAQDKKYGIENGVFKASAGWCSRFMERNGLTISEC